MSRNLPDDDEVKSARQKPSDLPGYTLPLNWIPHVAYRTYSRQEDGELKEVKHPDMGGGRVLFSNALDRNNTQSGWCNMRLTTLREFTMLQLMNHLTDKPDWDKKVFDDVIAAKWKEEAVNNPNTDITELMAEWCIEELRWKAKEFQKSGCVSVYDADVMKSDTAISDSLKEALKAAVKPLEDVPTEAKDYHPGSDGKVLDLVHPSLFPLVYGRTRILKDATAGVEDSLAACGKGETLPVPPAADADYMVERDSTGWNYRNDSNPYSRTFQWLPCDVQFTDEEKEITYSSQDADPSTTVLSNTHCKITSYINNLHPRKHQDLYHVMEHIIARAIPLWNRTLSPQDRGYGSELSRIGYESVKYKVEREEHPDCPEEPDDPEDEGPDDEGLDFWERKERWWEQVRELVYPEPGTFGPAMMNHRFYQVDESLRGERYLVHSDDTKYSSDLHVDLRRDFADTGLQVIVKLANIELTPEKPEYEGGTWHVEGQMNEHICATALYYYDNENITDSRLAFRHMASIDDTYEIRYEQGDDWWLEEIFGCEQHGAAVQEIGDVVCKEDRLITFPNFLQHQVQPFRLADPTKPGHRKIVALFLIDPNIRVISTANVPPQQREWWEEQLWESGALDKLPAELQTEVIKGVEDFPIDLAEAKELRLKLMEERSQLTEQQDGLFTAHNFSLCEH